VVKLVTVPLPQDAVELSYVNSGSHIVNFNSNLKKIFSLECWSPISVV
jgi:hypothetical protein